MTDRTYTRAEVVKMLKRAWFAAFELDETDAAGIWHPEKEAMRQAERILGGGGNDPVHPSLRVREVRRAAILAFVHAGQPWPLEDEWLDEIGTKR